MKTEVIKNLENATLEVRREFAATLPMVWRAFTEPDLLDQWWAPRPWKTETVSMDFRPGGSWRYMMVGPEGDRHHAMMRYDEIQKEVYFKGQDAFTDDQGNINESLPVASWRNSFETSTHGTLVIVFTQYPNKEALQTVLDMGVEEGLTMAQGNLDELLLKLQESDV